MQFSKEQFNVSPLNKEYAIRISNVNPYEMFYISKWDFTAKSVFEDNGNGIYGMSIGLFANGFDWFFRILISCCTNTDNIRVVLLEIDKSNIIESKSLNEIAFSKANIINTFRIDDFLMFAKATPLFDYKHIAEMIKISIKASEYYSSNNIELWLEQMKLSYQQMYTKLEYEFPSQNIMLRNARQENNKNRFMLLYKKMKEFQGQRKQLNSLNDLNILWNKL